MHMHGYGIGKFFFFWYNGTGKFIRVVMWTSVSKAFVINEIKKKNKFFAIYYKIILTFSHILREM